MRQWQNMIKPAVKKQHPTTTPWLNLWNHQNQQYITKWMTIEVKPPKQNAIYAANETLSKYKLYQHDFKPTNKNHRGTPYPLLSTPPKQIKNNGTVLQSKALESPQSHPEISHFFQPDSKQTPDPQAGGRCCVLRRTEVSFGPEENAETCEIV